MQARHEMTAVVGLLSRHAAVGLLGPRQVGKTGGLMELSRVVKPPVVTKQITCPGGCGGSCLV